MRHIKKVSGDMKCITCAFLLILWEVTGQVLQVAERASRCCAGACACASASACACDVPMFQAAARTTKIYSLTRSSLIT